MRRIGRFCYALEPLLRKHAWELEALQAQLGAARRQRLHVQAALTDLQNQRHTLLAGAAQASLEPVMHQLRMAALLQLDESIASQRTRLDDEMRTCEALRETCRRAHQQLEIFREDRQRRAAQFGEEQQRLQQSEADEAWLLRLPMRQPECGRDGETQGGRP